MNFMIERKPVNEQFLNLLIGKTLKWVRIGVFVLICFNTTSAQNLIQDSSFEFNRYTPVNFSEINASYYWDKPSAGTSDLFCKCGKKQKKILARRCTIKPNGKSNSSFRNLLCRFLCIFTWSI